MGAVEVVGWSFSHFYHLDCANACIHTAPVRYSPITFRLAQLLKDIGGSNPAMNLVLADIGQYAEDLGR